MKFNNIEAVRSYIGGEQFDPIAYNREHMVRLAESVKRNIETISAYTVDRYVSNHLEHCIYPEFQQLLEAQKMVLERDLKRFGK